MYALMPGYGQVVHLRHQGKANLGFADGRACSKSSDEIDGLGEVCSDGTQYDRTRMSYSAKLTVY